MEQLACVSYALRQPFLLLSTRFWNARGESREYYVTSSFISDKPSLRIKEVRISCTSKLSYGYNGNTSHGWANNCRSPLDVDMPASALWRCLFRICGEYRTRYHSLSVPGWATGNSTPHGWAQRRLWHRRHLPCKRKVSDARRRYQVDG